MDRSSSDDQNMIIVLLHPGDDEAAKVAEAKLEHGLAEDDSGGDNRSPVRRSRWRRMRAA